ncbi:MAG: hypothetical protein KDB00_25165 [Planctomycetales bacterium]|nr:hypothetical protein [Planctomycetales bacterium]
MPFLRGSLGFQRFSVTGFEADRFGQEHFDILTNHAAGKFQTSSTDNVSVGFLGGEHLFDQDFDESKNLINNAVHFSARFDTNQIPAAYRAAWLQMELSGIAKDNEGGVITKAQRKEAKEAVEQRCETEAATGKYRKMQQFPLLWDYENEQLLFGGSVGTAGRHCLDLVERAFGIELRHLGAGALAEQWAIDNDLYAEVDDLQPVNFITGGQGGSHKWANEHSQAPDFLGNEFLLWLWWMLDKKSDNITLIDDSEVTVMLSKTLSLECPLGETGKESISAECPVKLPEAMQAIRSGKLPRKMGMTIIREGRQFDLVLQAESFGISGAKIHLEEDEEFDDDDRIDAIRQLVDTTDLMFHTFCDRRTGDSWMKDQKAICKWLGSDNQSQRKAA